MWKLIALLVIGVVGPALIWGGTTLALREDPGGPAGPTLPGAGTDTLPLMSFATIDVLGNTEVVPLNGAMEVSRGDPVPQPDGSHVIDVEIVSLSLTGTSSFFGAGTPVEISLDPNGPPSMGQIFTPPTFPNAQAESFFDVYYSIQVDTFEHNLQNLTSMQADSSLENGITQIPFFDSHWNSGPIDNPMVNKEPPFNTKGALSNIDWWIDPPEKAYTVTVLKRDKADLRGIPGWEINLFDGPCSDNNADIIDSGFTDDDGLIEFNIANPGSYSVEEKSEPGWNSVGPFCEDVDVPGTGGATAGLGPCPISPNDPPPAAGCDDFNSVATVRLIFTDPESPMLDCDLSGPTQIGRSAVIPGSLDRIDTELIAMELTGDCGATVRQSPDQQSLGQIVEQQNSTGDLDFSADSFFDIYFEVDTPLGTLHNQDPLHLECKIVQIPPYGCFYEPDVGVVPLYNDAAMEVGELIHAQHIPVDPKKQLIIFTNERKETPTPTPPGKRYSITVLKLNDATGDALPGWQMNLYAGGCDDSNASFVDSGSTGVDGTVEFADLPAGLYSVDEKLQIGWNPVGTDICQEVQLGGTAGTGAGFIACPTQPDLPFPGPGCDSFDSGGQVNILVNATGETFAVTLGGPTVVERGPVTDTQPNGLDNVDTEIVQLDLTGSHPDLGSVTVRQSSSMASVGQIEEQENGNPGQLDFPADSYFDVFFEVDLLGMTLHNQDAFRIECKLSEIPPIGCLYQPPVDTPVVLYNEAKDKIATIVHGAHVPLPPNKKLIVFRNREKDDKTYADMSVAIDLEPFDDECTGIKGFEPKIDDGEGVAIEVCVEINAVSAGGYSGWDVVLAYDDDSWTVDQQAGVERIGPCQTFSGALKSSGVQGDGLTGSIAFGCQSDTPSTALGPIASLVFISKKKGNVTPEFQDFTLLPKDSIDPVTDFDITGSSVYCETIELGKHNCDNIDLGFGSVLVNPQGTGNGDVSCDGITNSLDALFLLQFVAALLNALPCAESGDVNQDGVWTAVDATLILQFVAALIDQLPIGLANEAGVSEHGVLTSTW